MTDYDLLDPETEEEFQARMRDEEQAQLDREEYENRVFDDEVDWNQGEVFAMSGPE